MIKNIIRLFIGLFLLSAINIGYGEDLREDKNYPVGDIKAYAPYDWRHYPDVIALQKRVKSHLAHQYVWVYTKEFAKRFGMPSRWIGGEDFKGALALAYRQELRNDVWCGYFGSLDSCRQLSNYHVLDVYVPNDSKTIPWNTDERVGRIYTRGGTSVRFLKFFRNTQYEKDQYKDENGNLPSWYYEGPEGKKDSDTLIFTDFKGVGIDFVSTAYLFRRDGFGENGDLPEVREFHRNVLEGIDLITITGFVRFVTTGDGEAQIGFNEDINDSKKNRDKIAYNRAILKKYNRKTGVHKDFRADHTIYPGLDFMQRMKVYAEENEGGSFFEFFKNNINKNNK